MTLDQLNSMEPVAAFDVLYGCNASVRWIEQMVMLRPFESLEQVVSLSDEIWQGLSMPDFLQAFEGHPRIGDVESLKEKFASTKAWASNEQSGMAVANNKMIERLAQANLEYEARFGFIFIICATGKTAEEMLDALEARLINPLPIELPIAAAEQAKITTLRLQKLLAP